MSTAADPFCPPVPADFALPHGDTALKPLRIATARALLAVAQARLDHWQETMAAGYDQRPINEHLTWIDHAQASLIRRHQKLAQAAA